jgi:hypothetical protein
LQLTLIAGVVGTMVIKTKLQISLFFVKKNLNDPNGLLTVWMKLIHEKKPEVKKSQISFGNITRSLEQILKSNLK